MLSCFSTKAKKPKNDKQNPEKQQKNKSKQAEAEESEYSQNVGINSGKGQPRRLSKRNKVESEVSMQDQMETMDLQDRLNQHPDFQLCMDCLKDKNYIKKQLDNISDDEKQRRY